MTHRPRLNCGLAAGALACLLTAPAALAATSGGQAGPTGKTGPTGEDAPLNFDTTTTGGGSHVGGGGGGIVRTIVALLVVVGLIYGIAWALRQMRSSREQRARGRGLADVASVPLGAGRGLHLVRAGREYLLLGVCDGEVSALRTYDEAEAAALGLLDDEGPDDPVGGGPQRPGLGGLLDELRRRTVR